jgi:hypothetical protein
MATRDGRAWRGIFRRRLARASAAGMAAAQFACGGGKTSPSPQAPTPLRTLPLANVYLLGEPGPPIVDTTATFVSGTPRHLLIRNGLPDRTVIADLYFDAAAFASTIPGADVHVTVHADSGSYGLTIGSDTPFRAGGELTFKYAVHFRAPAEAVTRYPNDVVFERALAIGHVESNGQITLLPSTRPATDNLEATIAAPGTYVVAAPK